MKKVLVVVPIGSLFRRPRAYKLCHYLRKKNIDIEHWGWDRVNDGGREGFDFDIKKKLLLKGGGHSNALNKAMYLLWMMALFLNSFGIKKDTTVWAIGFESAFPLVLASKLKGFRLIFDDADRFSMVFNFPIGVKRIVEFFERMSSRLASLHVIPNRKRYDFDSDKFIEIKNFPAQSDIEKAKVLEPLYKPEHDELTVYVNGLLEAMRGVDTLLEVVRKLDDMGDKRVRFLVAGPLRGEKAERFVALHRVTYLGTVEPAESLSCYLVTDLVFTYYSPCLEINKYAESNKWGDALKMGSGIIVNSEVKTVDFLVEAGCVYRFDYHDVHGLCEFLLTVSKESISQKEKAARIAGEKYLSFESLLNRCFNL